MVVGGGWGGWGGWGHFHSKNRVTPTLSWVGLWLGWAVTISCLETKFPVTGRDVGLLLKQKIIFTYKRIVFPLQIKVLGHSKMISSDRKEGSFNKVQNIFW